MPKRKNVRASSTTAADAAESSQGSSRSSKAIENLKTLNEQLVEEVEARWDQIRCLRKELYSLAADQEILVGMERGVFGLVLSSSLSEAGEHNNAEMAAATKKAESAAAELSAVEIMLVDLDRKKDEIQRDLDGIAEERGLNLRSLEQAKNYERGEDGGRRWKKWIYPVAAVASFCVATAIVTFLGKGSDVKITRKF